MNISLMVKRSVKNPDFNQIDQYLGAAYRLFFWITGISAGNVRNTFRSIWFMVLKRSFLF